MAEKSKNEKKYKYKFIQFSVSDELKKDIDEWTEKSTSNTISDFVRNAVEEKIRSLKTPETSQPKTENQITPAFFEQVLKNSHKYNLLQEELLKRMKIVDEIKADLERIKKFSIKRDLKEEANMIVNLLKAHKSLSRKQIMEKTDLDKETIYDVVSTNEKIKLNMNGRFELNE